MNYSSIFAFYILEYSIIELKRTLVQPGGYVSCKVTKLKGCPVAFLCSVAVSLSGNWLLHLSHLYELCITNALCTLLVNIVSYAVMGLSSLT